MKREQFYSWHDDVQQVTFRWSAVANMVVSGPVITVYLHNHFSTSMNVATGLHSGDPGYVECCRKAESIYREMVAAWRKAVG